MKKGLLRNIAIALSFSLIGIMLFTNAAKAKTPPRPTKAIQSFIQYMVKKHGFQKDKLTALMKKAKYDPKVIVSIKYPFEKKPWDYYRRYFLSKDRIEGGVEYWKTHLKTLNAVKKHYGVPPDIIIAIIAVESKFGRHTGGYNELNALSTLAFYYPPRSKFFKKELEHYLLLARKEKLSPLKIQGSYAGALGIPQFMPSSYRHYGVDYSKNQSVDLMSNHKDAIASVANYLKQSGWRQDQPVAVPAKIIGKIPQQLISKRARPKYTIEQLEKYQIYPVEKESPKLMAALIAMHSTDSTEYWIVLRNFHAIMKYNPNTTYSLAVYELSRAIKKSYEQQTTKTSTTTTSGGAAKGS